MSILLLISDQLYKVSILLLAVALIIKSVYFTSLLVSFVAYRALKITMRIYYGGAGGPILAPLLTSMASLASAELIIAVCADFILTYGYTNSLQEHVSSVHLQDK